MKALKLSAVIFTALLALSACKTAPGGGSSADAKAQEGLNDALEQVGGVAGMTGYTQKLSGSFGKLTNISVAEIYFDNLTTPASFKQVWSSLYNGTSEEDGVSSTHDNEVISKGTTSAGVKLLVKGTDYTSYKYTETNSDGTIADVTLTDADLAGYVFIELTDPVSKSWTSTSVGGSGQWETAVSHGAQRYALKVDGNKLYFMGIFFRDPDMSTLRFGDGDPRSPSKEESIFTKK